ncbi:MAG TPA: AzlD domain-containing protein [Synergistaceae bacterium]|nr:AzlD domain-containing protein [Synergistaceae bacterium]HPJ25858.1 AzlD domain-containing protein [Synergistaceae bacterium]HPQ36953.1 AzlD domain-containing protein [Synergistaceae bacterium]
MRYYAIIFGVALGSLFIKSIFLCGFSSHRLPSWITENLDLIPPAVLAGLVAPALVYAKTPEGLEVYLPKILAGAGAFWIALRGKNVLYTILAGMILLGIFSRFPG